MISNMAFNADEQARRLIRRYVRTMTHRVQPWSEEK
jgi:hypothetical protein